MKLILAIVIGLAMLWAFTFANSIWQREVPPEGLEELLQEACARYPEQTILLRVESERWASRLTCGEALDIEASEINYATATVWESWIVPMPLFRSSVYCKWTSEAGHVECKYETNAP